LLAFWQKAGDMRLEALRPCDLTGQQEALYGAITGGPRGPVHVTADGSLGGPFNAFLHNAAIGMPLYRVGAALRYDGLLAPAAREVAILVVAAAHGSELEWRAHAPVAEELGVTAEQIDAIRCGRPPVLEDEVQQAAADAARAILARHDLTDGEYDRVVQAIGVDGLIELTTLVGYYGVLASQLRLFRVPPPAGGVVSFPARNR
jgi:4-carboxymuconolactone decarboxylase